MDPAIFLDRDGTLVPENAAEVDASKLAPLGGVTDALKRLRESGFRLVVATNQGAVARGRASEADVDAFNQRLGALIDGRTGIARTIERFYYCPFDPKGTVPEYSRDHPWRKPNPGMLRQAARDMSLDLARSWLIGGSPNDIAAGRTAGVRTVLVSRELAHIAEAAADFTVASMADAVAIVLKHQSDRPSPRPAAAATAAPQRASAATAAAATATAARPRTRKSSTERLRRARDGERLRRALGELAEEVRALRLRRSETGSLRIGAMALQLATLLVAAVAILSLAEPDAFMRLAVGAVFLQLATATVLLFDRS